MVNLPFFLGSRLNANANAQSASPYNITTGSDDNLDGVVNDRPGDVGRNSARGSARFDVSMRLEPQFLVWPAARPRRHARRQRSDRRRPDRRARQAGPADGAAAGGGNVPAGGVPGGAAPQLGQGGGPGGPGGGGPGGGGNPFANSNQRFSAEVWISANNVFNRVNYVNYVGNLRSPFFGQRHVGRAGAPCRGGHELPFLARSTGQTSSDAGSDFQLIHFGCRYNSPP